MFRFQRLSIAGGFQGRWERPLDQGLCQDQRGWIGCPKTSRRDRTAALYRIVASGKRREGRFIHSLNAKYFEWPSFFLTRAHHVTCLRCFVSPLVVVWCLLESHSDGAISVDVCLPHTSVSTLGSAPERIYERNKVYRLKSYFFTCTPLPCLPSVLRSRECV